VGLFSSRDRGDKTSVNLKRKTTPANARGERTEDSGQSKSKAPASPSAGSKLDADQQSRKRESASTAQRGAQGDKFMAMIGQSIVFKGELTGDEDLEIDGQVEGDVNLKNHQLTIGANGHLKAEVAAKSIIIIGRVKGNLVATERIEIQATGVVEGDIHAPRLNIQEGAVLNGSIDMSATSTSTAKMPSASSTSSTSSTSSAGPPPGEALQSA
jgi:cytoskeletal protein CcmA (bactofilin family)